LCRFDFAPARLLSRQARKIRPLPGVIKREWRPCRRNRMTPDAQTRRAGDCALCRRTGFCGRCDRRHQAVFQRVGVGPSRLALEAYAEAAKGVSIYPEGSARILREAVGYAYGLDAARIVCGNGSDELLHHARQRLSQPRRRGAVQRARFSRLSHRGAWPTALCRLRCRRTICAPT